MINMTRRGFLGAVLAGAATAVAAKVLPADPKPLLKGEVGVIRDFVIVTDKPYLADPTGMRDSTQAFQDAIRSGAKEIRVPAGRYNISGVVIDRNVTLKGEGPDKTTLVCFGGRVNGYDHKHGLHIKGEPGTGGIVAVSGLNLVGVGPGEAAGMMVQHKTLVDDCRVQGFHDGVRIESPTVDEGVYFATIRNTMAVGNERDGFSFGEGSVGNIAIGCSAYGNGRYGFYVPTTKRTYGNSIYGAYAEAA